MILQIKRGNRVIAESADFSYSPSLQEVRKLTCEVVSVVPIEFKAYNSKSESEYDTVVYNGNTFILYQAPSGDNLNEAGKYKYSLLFYGKEVLLQNVAFLDIVSGTGGEINKIRYTHGGLFQFWGDAKQLAARIEANIESYNASLGAGYTGIGTWTLNVDAEGELTEDMIDITDGTNLFEALKNFYDKFYLNYYFSTTANGGIITITDKTRPSVNWTFKQGDGGGAVKVSSSVDTSTPVITRIIPQGGSRNVPPEYKKDAKPADESRYCPYILLPNDSDGNIRYYIDSEYGLKNYGVRGKTISNTFSGIYPSIRGKKLGDLYPSGLPEWDTYKADGEPDPQSGKVAGEGASASTRIDKIIGSTPIKSDDSDSFFIYMTSPGFNLGYKVYEDGDSSDKINDNVQPQYKPHAMFDKYRDFERFDIYGTRAYYDQPVKVTATFSGKMLFSILPIGSDAVGKKVKINLRMVLNRVLGQASPLKEVVIGEEGATGMLEIPYDKTSLVGYIEKGQNTTVTIRVEFTFDSDVPAGSCKIGFSEEMTCNIHFGNQDGSQDRFYYKYASVTDAVFSMRTGTYTGTEFKINKNGIIPLYGEVNGDTGETEEDVAMFNKGARYKISCYRTDSDNAKLPLYTDGKSPSIAAGTEFVILNIVMPESYVTMAENTLEKAALDYLSRYDHENRTVSLDISSGFVAEHPNLFIDFIEGNMLKVRDDGIGVFDFSDNGQIVDMQLQIQSLEIKYSKENMFPSYSCTIARRKILSFYERLAQENQTASTQNTTNVTLGGSGTGSGTNIFSEQLLNDLIASFQKFNGWFEWDEVNQALRCKSAFYTNQWISALGAQSGSGEPGGGEGGLIKAVYGFADLGKTFDDSNLSNTFNAYTINEIWKLAKEGGMNTDKLWQELGKDDPTKKIHISHLPDNKFVTLDTEQTVTASKIFTGQLSTANVVPSVNNASTLGLESKRWENIYAVDANISGTVKTQALQVGDIKIIYDSVNKAVTFEHIDGSTEIGFYTRGWISALGVSPGGSGGSGGDGLVKNVYGFSNLGTTFSDSDLDNTFNAYTIKKLYDMAGQGGLDADAMWAELKKADSSKIIDASHIPTSVLDGRWVTLSTNQTITGQKTFTQNILFSNNITGIRNTAGNLVFGAGNENIFCILNNYVGPVKAKNNQLVLGNDVGYWKKVTAGQYISKVATGVSPLIVSSNTLVNNLNADLLDGYHQSSFLRADGVNQYVTLSGGDGNNEGYRLVFEGTVTGGWSINSMTLLVNSRHAGTGMISIVFHTTNQESTSYVGSLNYYGSILALGYTMWRLFYNTTTKKVRLFWRFYDYSDCKVSILNSRGLTTNISNKTWYTTIPSDSGSELPSYYNRSDTTGSLATSRTLWGQPFNGTANVSGDMTGVGSINMSGQLTSTVASGVAPFIVVSNTVVGNLNADMVDGLHENSFLRHRDTYGIDGYNTLWSQIGIRQYNNAKPDGMANPIYDYGAVISLPGENTRLDIWYNRTSSASDSPTNGIQYRSGFNDDKRPWRMLLDSVNYASYSDGRYVKKAGDTMTGDLNISGGHILYMLQTSPTSTQQIHLQGGSNDYGRIAFGATGSNAGWMEIASCDDGNEPIYARQYTGVFTTVKNTLTLLDANGDTVMSNNKGLSVGWGSRQVREGGSWVHGGADAANSDDANLRFGSWMGIGWYPTISGQTVAQGKNAMWLNTRTGVLNVVGGIKESTICIGRVNSSGGYDTAYNGEINRYDHHLFLQHHSGKYLIMCTGGGLAGIGTNSPGEKLHVAGNTRTDGYFKSTVGTGTAPYQCSSTTLNTNLNADMLDNWHLNFLPRNYNNARTYSVQFALGGTDNNWRKIFACSESGAGPYRSVTVWGQIWYAYGNHAQEEVRYYHFCAIFQMRTGPSASDSNVGNVSNSARLYLPTFAKGMDNIRLVRVGTNNFELQVRQIYSYHNGHIQYQYWANGANVSAWENLQSTSNTSVAVSAGGASTLADSRASSADVLTTSRTLWGRPFNGSANIDGNIDNAAVITSKGGIWLDLKGSSGVAFYAGGSLCAVMNTTGVGIGTSSPSQKLHVAGNIIATGAITAKASSSDIRLKTDIQGYDAMGIIRKFRSVKYHWNNLAKRNSEIFNHKKWNYGLIAQDLLSGGYSQWVSDIFKDYYTIDYERLIPVVWKGLQEVDDEVTRLKKRVKELEKRLGINN